LKIKRPISFPQEYHQHGDEFIAGELILHSKIGTYTWQCPCCKIRWVTVGSVMDIANEIAFSTNNKLPDS
jgi:hypothetical protein